jgi:hypothetical protein
VPGTALSGNLGGVAGRRVGVGIGAVVLAVALVACSSGSSRSLGDRGPATTTTTTEAATTSTTEAADAAAWAALDEDLAALGPRVGFLAAEVGADGACDPVHAVAPTTARPAASQFKLFVLGALAEAVVAGTVAWDEAVTVDDATRSLGNAPETPSLQFVPAGTAVPVSEAATKMIAISDNTATDVLMARLGREAVEDHAATWIEDPAANEPFLTTRQVLLLHYAEGLGDRYLATPPAERAAFLAAEVDPLPLDAIGSAFATEPRFIDTIEWFASPADVCRALAGLHAQARDPALATTLPTVLSQNVLGIDLAPETWPTVWYKGGSEPGVLTVGWLATTAEGRTFVVQAMVSDPDAALAESAIPALVDLGRDAFALLARA